MVARLGGVGRQSESCSAPPQARPDLRTVGIMAVDVGSQGAIAGGVEACRG